MNLLCILHRPFLHIDQRCILSVHGYGRHAYMHTCISHVCTTYVYLLYLYWTLFIGSSYNGQRTHLSIHGQGSLICTFYFVSRINTLYSLPVYCTSVDPLYTWTEDASPLYLGKVYSLSILFQHCRYIFHTVNRSFLNMNEGYVFTEHSILISLFYAYCKCLL
jgi:hypothetical protein